MIDRSEILRLANETGLEARVVEKDYVLGWMLSGIFRDPLDETPYRVPVVVEGNDANG